MRLRILGIDPGSRLTGYGCIDVQGPSIQHVDHGVIRLMQTSESEALEHRLHSLFQELSRLIGKHKPDVLAIERVFFAKNVASALKLGHARGVIILSGAQAGLKIAEYTPTEIKSALTGSGRSEKHAVAQFVKLVLGPSVREFATFDASDALAIAICHARMTQTAFRSSQTTRARELYKRTANKKRLSMAESVGHKGAASVQKRTRDRDGRLK